MSRFLRARRTWFVVVAMAALTTAIAIPPVALADSGTGCDFAPNGPPACIGPLSGSTFAGADGNLLTLPPTFGTTDWQNVADLSTGIDQPSGTGDNSFGQGTKEDNAAVTVVSGSIPPNKSDLIRFYEASETNTGTNQVYLYLAWERTNVLGSANMDFEINQHPTAGLIGTFTGPITLNRTAGDLLVTYDFTNGGSQPTLGLLTWLTSANGTASQCFSSSSLPCWGAHVTLNGSDSEGAINTDPVTDPIASRTLAAGTFGEAAINLTAAGVFPSGVCEAFGSVFLKSRSSASFNAEVKDFVAPTLVNITNCKNPTISTAVFDASTSAAWSGTEITGASAYDTATLTGASATASGTVTYYFFGAGQTCTNGTIPAAGTFTSSSTATVLNGIVGNSATVGPLAAGSYNFLASYGGDTINHANVSACEPFSVAMAPTTTATVLHNASDGSVIAINTSLPLGTSVYDSSTVGIQADGKVISGTVTYNFFTNSGCTGNSTSQQVTIDSAGNVPNSTATAPLSAGNYAFKAVYGGDSNYAGSTSSCEPFAVGKAPTTAATTLHNAADNSTIAVNSSVALGTSVYDSSTVGAQVDGKVISGTVTYNFFSNNACTGNSTSQQVTIDSAGNVPNSSATEPLAAGSYAFQATYSGDGNYTGVTSPCEPFNVSQAATTTATTLHNAADNSVIAVNSSVALGTSVYDSSTVGPQVNGKVISGTVTYTFFTNGTCTGSGTTQVVTIDGSGKVPNSGATGPLSAGNYAFQAVYGGDSNYMGSPSSCENFTVNPAATATATVLHNAADNSTIAVNSTVGPNTSVYDSSTVGPQVDGKVISGTVIYTFFNNIGCTGVGASQPAVTINGNGTVPNSTATGPLAAGSYAFQAVYSGDSNYTGSTSLCEPFTVLKAQPSASTAQDLIPNDSFTLTGGAAGDGTGTITFYLFAPNATCNLSGTGAAYTQTVSENAANTDPSGVYKTTNLGTGAFHANTPGTWTWAVVYNGDDNNRSATSNCVETFTINNG